MKIRDEAGEIPIGHIVTDAELGRTIVVAVSDGKVTLEGEDGRQAEWPRHRIRGLDPKRYAFRI